MKLKTILSIFLFIIIISFISAESVCFPDKTKVCNNAIEQNGYFYCDIEEVSICNNECMINLNGDDYCMNLLQKIIYKIKKLLIRL